MLRGWAKGASGTPKESTQLARLFGVRVFAGGIKSIALGCIATLYPRGRSDTCDPSERFLARAAPAAREMVGCCATGRRLGDCSGLRHRDLLVITRLIAVSRSEYAV